MEILDIIFSSLRMATPLIFASLAGLICEKSGLVNMAIEAQLLIGAFVGSVIAYFLSTQMTEFLFFVPWVATFFAMLFGGLSGYFLCFLIQKGKIDPIVAGMSINLLVVGAIPQFSKYIFDTTGPTPSIELHARFTFGPLLLACFLVFIFAWILKNLRWGLWLHFTGDNPEALASEGIDPKKIRMTSFILAGSIAAIGGTSLSLYLASSYTPLMSGGRGFIALAAVVFGRWKAIPILSACLLFGFMDAIQMRLQGTQLYGVQLPVQFVQMLPYLSVLIAPILSTLMSRKFFLRG